MVLVWVLRGVVDTHTIDGRIGNIIVALAFSLSLIKPMKFDISISDWGGI